METPATLMSHVGLINKAVFKGVSVDFVSLILKETSKCFFQSIR